MYQNHLEGIEMSTQWLYNIFYIRLGGNRIKFCRRILVIPIWKHERLYKIQKKCFVFSHASLLNFFFLICLKILCRTAGRVIDTISRMEPSRFFNISSEKTSNESDFLLACHCISITIALRVNFKVLSGIKFCGYRVHLKKF